MRKIEYLAHEVHHKSLVERIPVLRQCVGASKGEL